MCASWHRSQVKLQIDFEMAVLCTVIVQDARRSDLLHLLTSLMTIKQLAKQLAFAATEIECMPSSTVGIEVAPEVQYSMHGSTSRHMRSLNRRPAGSSTARYQGDRDRNVSRRAVLVARSQRRCPPAMRALSLPCVMRALSSPPCFESLN